MLIRLAFVLLILSGNLSLALSQAEKIQKAREDIFSRFEDEGSMEIEEIIIDDEGNELVLPLSQPKPITTLPEPNLPEGENLPILNLEENNTTPKKLYLSYLNPISRSLYVNEVIPLEFKLVAFGVLQNEIITEFIGNNKSVYIINQDSPWRQNIDGTYHNTYYVQIRSASFVMPKIRVSIEGQKGEEVAEESGGFSGQAISLSGNPLFSGVIASSFKLDDYKITNYDMQNNLAVFAISTGISNLRDFRIGDYARQNYESGVISPERSSMIYYVILPKEVEPIVFDYFSIDDFQFHRISVANVPVDDRVSTQSDLKPKRSVSVAQLIIGIGVILFLLIIFFVFHSYMALVAMALVAAYLITDFFITDNARLLPNAEVKILPTFNSTVIIRQDYFLNVEILDKREGFYKIVTQDGRIGWVRREEVVR